MLYNINDIFDNGVEYPSVDIDTPFLTTKKPNVPVSHLDQAIFKAIVNKFMDDIAKKSLVLKTDTVQERQHSCKDLQRT